MKRSTLRGKQRPAKAEAKHFPPEKLAERVFVEAPRVFSFSHRPTGSLRHPYLPLIVEMADRVPQRKRLDTLLESFLNVKREQEKWKRVGALFDTKMEAPELDKMRMEIFVNVDIMSKVEALWALLGGTQGSFLTNEAYRRLHARLYSVLLGSDDVSLTTTTIATVNEDYAYDARDFAGVSFGSFGLSMLELADNWTASRKPADYAAFLQMLVDSLEPASHRLSNSKVDTTNFTLSDNVFFSGGVLVKQQTENHVQYSKAPVM